MQLNPKEELFLANYIESGNGTQAYIDSYGANSRGVAAVEASKLLRRPHIRQALDAMMEDMTSDSIADAVEVMEYYTAVMRGDIKETVLLAGAHLVEREPLIRDRTKAAEQLSKRFGLDQSSFAKSLEIRRLDLMMKQVEIAMSKGQGDEEALAKLDEIMEKIDGELSERED